MTKNEKLQEYARHRCQIFHCDHRGDRYCCHYCGHKTKLHDLKPAFLKCKCGSQYKYKTNITDEVFDFPCLNCGSPVDMELNQRRNTYVTIKD